MAETVRIRLNNKDLLVILTDAGEAQPAIAAIIEDLSNKVADRTVLVDAEYTKISDIDLVHLRTLL